MNDTTETEILDAEAIPEAEVVHEEPEDPRNHGTLVADIERMRHRGFATGTLCGVDLNRLSPADLRALETQALAEKVVTLRTRAEGAAREQAFKDATLQTREQALTREAERVVNLHARHRARATENDQRMHSVRGRVETPEPPLAA